tara:strand:+ start:44 stop:238 length:195 start_codon:yes stop_codon:yes gene_type:complete
LSEKKNVYNKKSNIVGIVIPFEKPINRNFYIIDNKGKKELLNNVKLIHESLNKKIFLVTQFINV